MSNFTTYSEPATATPYDRTRTLVVVEDDQSCRDHFTQAAMLLDGNWRTHVFACGNDALDAIERHGFYADAALVDIGLPDISGIEVIRGLRKRCPTVRSLVVSSLTSERSVLMAIRAGASGYLLKDGTTSYLARNIGLVLAGEYPISPSLARHLFRIAGAPETDKDTAISLTDREKDVLQSIARGCSYTQVAKELQLSLSTIQTHIRNLYSKLGVHSQVQAVSRARGMGLV